MLVFFRLARSTGLLRLMRIAGPMTPVTQIKSGARGIRCTGQNNPCAEEDTGPQLALGRRLVFLASVPPTPVIPIKSRPSGVQYTAKNYSVCRVKLLVPITHFYATGADAPLRPDLRVPASCCPNRYSHQSLTDRRSALYQRPDLDVHRPDATQP